MITDYHIPIIDGVSMITSLPSVDGSRHDNHRTWEAIFNFYFNQ